MPTHLNRTLLPCFITALFAAQACLAQTSLSVGNVPGYPGSTVSVPVNLRQGSNTVAAQFDVAYNPNKVSALGALRGERLTNHVLRSRQVTQGVRRVLLYSPINAHVAGTNATVVSLPFTVSPAEYVGSGPLTPTNIIIVRGDATPVTLLTPNSGTIFVRPVNPLPDGTIQFFLPSAPDVQYTVEATSNLVNWSSISTNLATGDYMNLLDFDGGSYPYRFYRWRRDP